MATACLVAWILTTHRWLGTGTAVLAVALLFVQRATPRGEPRTKLRLLLFAAAVLVLVTGFFGGAMIYGLDHYALPD